MRTSRNRLLIGIQSNILTPFTTTQKKSSFNSIPKSVESLEKLLLSEVGGLFLWPTFLDEDSAHYEMLPIILPKLRLKMNSKRLTRRKKIVLGMRIEQLSSIARDNTFSMNLATGSFNLSIVATSVLTICMPFKSRWVAKYGLKDNRHKEA
ncbi:hypothetical protein GPALN_014887 [Globodera pallida]|nr:hypothetical protein GPALN_014887 [Globodera pallida]